jgi:hypothetical protein
MIGKMHFLKFGLLVLSTFLPFWAEAQIVVPFELKSGISFGFTETEIGRLEDALRLPKVPDFEFLQPILVRDPILHEKLKLLASDDFIPAPWSRPSNETEVRPVYLMVDMDDVLLKDAEYKSSLHNPNVQKVTYRPTSKYMEILKRRLIKIEGEDRVVHFKFLDENTVESLVVIRPSLADFLSRLRPFMAEGSVQVYLTSANDTPRVRAVWSQVKFGEETLESLGVKVADRTQFEPRDYNKDINLFRASLQVPESSRVFALDDIPENYTYQGPLDHLITIKPRSRETTLAAVDPYANEDFARFRWLMHQVQTAMHPVISSGISDRLRSIARVVESARTDCQTSFE